MKIAIGLVGNSNVAKTDPVTLSLLDNFAPNYSNLVRERNYLGRFHFSFDAIFPKSRAP